MFFETLLISLVVVAPLLVAALTDPSLLLEISGPAAVDGVDNFNIITRLTNNGNETVRVLNDPNGPLSKRPTFNTFSIAGVSGSTPSFTGIKVKYVPQTAADVKAFTTLPPGQSVEVEHNLSEAYNFSLCGAGSYEIQPNNLFYLVNVDSTIRSVHADTTTGHTAELSGRLAVARPSVERRASFNGCTRSQQARIGSVIPSAQVYASSTYTYASSLTTGTPRYQTWFGRYSTTNHNFVVSHFAQISRNTFSAFTYDCTCADADTYAFVDPDQFGVIHFCGAFWSAPDTGSNSKAGTIIHEASHFTVNGGTEDYVYSLVEAKKLAASDPNTAAMNADNHEYFAENTPALL